MFPLTLGNTPILRNQSAVDPKMKFVAKKHKTATWTTLTVAGLMLANISPIDVWAVEPTAPELTLQTMPNPLDDQSTSETKTESAKQLLDREEILSLCEKLAAQEDTSQLRPLFTEDAFKTQCGEWLLTAVNFAGVEGELEDLAALNELKQFVRENKLNELDLEAAFADDESMFGGKKVAEAYQKLPAETRLEIALQCGTLVNTLTEQLRSMEQAPAGEPHGEQDAKPSSSEQDQETADGIDMGLLEIFLGGAVQEITWEGNRATVRAGTQPSDLSDEELKVIGLERKELTESPFPDKFLNFVQIDGKWLFDGVDTAKSYASFKDKMQKFPSLGMELTLPLIENIQLAGEGVSGKPIALPDYKGKVVLVDCWGTWCGPCVASLPKLKELYKEFHDQGLEIIGVAADEKEELEQFLAKQPLPWDHIIDAEGTLAASLGVEAYPTLLLVDRDGKNVKNFVGDSAELKQAIRTLLEGKSLEPTLEQADDDTPRLESDK
jgi:thiol-disulfide isomerase/thioredoxin